MDTAELSREATFYRERANHVRRLAAGLTDQKTIDALRAHADDLEAQGQAIDMQIAAEREGSAEVTSVTTAVKPRES